MDTTKTIFFTCLIDFPLENATFAAGYEERSDHSRRSCCYLISHRNGRVAALDRDSLKWKTLDFDRSAFIRDHVQFAWRIGTPCEVSLEPIRWELPQYARVRGT